MRGISGWGTYIPYRRLDRTTIAPIAGGGGGKGARAVASYDEDTTTMGVEAARAALRAAGEAVEPSSLWFATVVPAYVDKTNATAIHAALRLNRSVPAYDVGGSVRSALGALRAALTTAGTSVVVAADLRGGLPGSPDESIGGDGAAALLVGDDPVAEVIGWESVTHEFLDRWRAPGDIRSKVWEERFGETEYMQVGIEAWEAALKAASLAVDAIDHVVVVSMHERAASAVAKKIGVPADIAATVADSLAATVGNTGAAHPALLLAATLEHAEPDQVIALVALADGADVVLLRTTAALAEYRPARRVADHVASGAPVAYGKYLAWRGLLPVEPPRRPEPARPSASAAGRSVDWKFGLEGHAEIGGTVATFTIDKLAYSPSPPVVFAVVDFDDGRRLPVELTDVDADEVAIGSRVEMTFRRLFTADGIHNYFWKGRLVR